MKHVFNWCQSLGQVNLRQTTRHHCGNVIRRLMFSKRYFGKGREDGGPTMDEEQHVDALFNAVNYLYAFCVSDYFPFLVGLDLDGHEKVVKDCTRTFRRLHEPIVNERIKQWRDHSSSQRNYDGLGGQSIECSGMGNGGDDKSARTPEES
ncbi:hypothetical protein NL676_019655 [Syzygium grande]|nr:hypothetical protein NL676_019655 [Syzygium grande]